MQWPDFIMVALVAIVGGSIAQLTSGYSRGGWIVNLGVAFIGALAGVVGARLLNAPEIYNLTFRMVNFPIIYSIVGCALLLAALGFLVTPHGR